MGRETPLLQGRCLHTVWVVAFGLWAQGAGHLTADSGVPAAFSVRPGLVPDTISIRMSHTMEVRAGHIALRIDPAKFVVTGVRRGHGMFLTSDLESNLFPDGEAAASDGFIPVSGATAPLDGEGNAVKGGVILGWRDSPRPLAPETNREVFVLRVAEVTGNAGGCIAVEFLPALRAQTDKPLVTNSVVNADQESFAASTRDGDTCPPLLVTQFAPNASGFEVEFSRAVDVGLLNIYRGAGPGGSVGQFEPDIVVERQSVAPGASPIVDGSAVFHPLADRFRFVSTGGPLLPNSYAVRLRSASHGFFDLVGHPLDGDGDGAPGGDFQTVFTTRGPLPIHVSVSDVARGPGQTVGIPASSPGFPIRVSDAGGIRRVELGLQYDPSLLDVTKIELAPGMPRASSWLTSLDAAGAARVAAAFATDLPAGERDLFRVISSVPQEIPYGASQALRLVDLSVNNGEIAALPDDGVQVVAFFGDTTGNSDYSALDGQRLARVLVDLDTGFAAFPLISPATLADITGNGRLSALDSVRILERVVGLDPTEIPPLPTSFAATGEKSSVGPEDEDGDADTTPRTRHLRFANEMAATPGETISVPVLVDDPAAIDAVEVRLHTDTARLEVLDVHPGALLADARTHVVSQRAGAAIVAAIAILDPATPRSGELLRLELRVESHARPGEAALDLQYVVLNERNLLPAPQPIRGWDRTDGVIQILPAPAHFQRGDANGDATLDISDALYTLSFLFGSELDIGCEDAADGNDDGKIDIADPIFALNHLFTGGPAFPSPYRTCGQDGTRDELTCMRYPECSAAE